MSKTTESTPQDELTRRAEEEVAKEFGKPEHDKTSDPLGLIGNRFNQALTLSVRLMRYKLQVEEAKKEMEEEMCSTSNAADNEIGEHKERAEILLRGQQRIYSILTKHTQEEQ